MSKSIAVWIDQDFGPDSEAHLHINYWIIKQKYKLREHLIDFGIKLKNWRDGTICFYLPLALSKENVKELGHELRNEKLASALFNENCTVIQESTKQKQVSIQSGEETLTVYLFDTKNDIEIEEKYSGSIISIKLPQSDHLRDWYLRFRIRCNNGIHLEKKIDKIRGLYTILTSKFFKKSTLDLRSIFSENHTPIGSFYQSVRSSVDAIDFRLNNKRTLDPSLLDEKGDKLITFNKIHFFLMNDQKEEVSFASVQPTKTRLLEKQVWSKYLSDLAGEERKYCASHWTCTCKRSWEIFIKEKFPNSNIFTICLYFAIVFIIGFSINILSSIIFYSYNQ